MPFLDQDAKPIGRSTTASEPGKPPPALSVDGRGAVFAVEKTFGTLPSTLPGLSAVGRSERTPHAVLIFFDVGKRERIVGPCGHAANPVWSNCFMSIRRRSRCVWTDTISARGAIIGPDAFDHGPFTWTASG